MDSHKNFLVISIAILLALTVFLPLQVSQLRSEQKIVKNELQETKSKFQIITDFIGKSNRTMMTVGRLIGYRRT
jgi:hypothetical protein